MVIDSRTAPEAENVERQATDEERYTALNGEIEAYCRSLGLDLYGVASAAAYEERFPEKPKPSSFVSDAQSIIVIGIAFEPSTVATVLHPHLSNLRPYTPEQIANPRSIEQPPEARRFFLFDERTMIIQEMNWMAYRIAKKLRREGWRTFHVPVIAQDTRRRVPPFQHMPAIYLAGLGTLGLNCCVLTPEFGPRAFFTTIITNIPLPAGQPMEKEMCTHCNLCVEACPMGCIDGRGWKSIQACTCCRTCLAICPVGKDAKEVRSYLQ